MWLFGAGGRNEEEGQELVLYAATTFELMNVDIARSAFVREIFGDDMPI